MTWFNPSIKPTERDIHFTVIDYCKRLAPRYPEFGMVIGYPSQGGFGKDAIIRGQIRKKEGQAKGFPDIMILVPRGEYSAAFLEIKREGEKPRKDQLDWLERLSKCGYLAEWRAGVDPCIKFIRDYLRGKK